VPLEGRAEPLELDLIDVAGVDPTEIEVVTVRP
jgi:hypothetical protein